MIKAKDWIPFLEHGVPLSELPIPQEHLPFCKRWIRRQSQKVVTNEAGLSLTALVSRIESQGGYPPRKYNREAVRLNFGIHYYIDTKSKK